SVSFSGTVPSYVSTLSLHDALPIFAPLRAHLRGPMAADDRRELAVLDRGHRRVADAFPGDRPPGRREPVDVHVSPSPVASCRGRSEEHTSELQSRSDLVCRLLLEKK